MCNGHSPQGAGGECGLRGGYVEMTNIHPGAVEEMYKIASINLSPNTVGQMAMSIMVNPPKVRFHVMRYITLYEACALSIR